MTKTVTAAYALTSPDHRLAAVSQEFASLLGYTPADLCGRTFESITYPADAAIDSDLAEKLFKGQIPSYEIAKRYVHRDGRLVKILLHVSTLTDATGRIAFAVVHVRPLGVAPAVMPVYQHPTSPSDEIDKIKRAMLG